MSISQSSEVVIRMVADSFTYPSVGVPDTVLFVRLGPGSEQIDSLNVRRPIDPIPFPDAPREFSVLAPNNHSDPGRLIAGSLPVHPHATIPSIPTHHFASSFLRQHGAETKPISAISIPPGVYYPSPVTTGPFVIGLHPDSLGRAAMHLRIVAESDSNLLTLDDTTGLSIKYDTVPDIGGVTLVANEGYPWIVERVSPMSIGLISNPPSDSSHSTRRCSLVRGVASILYQGDMEGVGVLENGGFGLGWSVGRTYSFVRDSSVTNPPLSATMAVNPSSGDDFSSKSTSAIKGLEISDFLGLDRLAIDSAVWIYGVEDMGVPSGTAIHKLNGGGPFVTDLDTSVEFRHVQLININAIDTSFVSGTGIFSDVQIEWDTMEHAIAYSYLSAFVHSGGSLYTGTAPIAETTNRVRLLIARTSQITGESGGTAVSLHDLNIARIGCIEITSVSTDHKVNLSISVRGWWGGNATFMTPTPLISTPSAPAPFVSTAHTSGKSNRNCVISLPIGANGGPRIAEEATFPGAVTDIIPNLSELSTDSLVIYTYRTSGVQTPFGFSKGKIIFWRPNHHTEPPNITTILLPTGFSLEVSSDVISGSSVTFQTSGRGMLSSYESPFSQGSDAHLVEAYQLLDIFNTPSSDIAKRIWSEPSPFGGIEQWSKEAIRVARTIETLARSNPSAYPAAVPPGPLYSIVGAEAAKHLWIGLRSLLVSGAPHTPYATGLGRRWVTHSWESGQIGEDFGTIVESEFGKLQYDRSTSILDPHHRSPFGGFAPRGGVEATRWCVVLDPSGATNVPAKADGTNPNDYTIISSGVRVARVAQLSFLEPDPSGTASEDVRITTDFDLAYYGHHPEVYGRLLYIAAVCYEYGGSSVYSYNGLTSETVATGIKEFLLSNTSPVEAVGGLPSSGEPFPLLQVLLNVSSLYSVVAPEKPGDGTRRYFPIARGHDPWMSITQNSSIGLGLDQSASSFGDITLCYSAAARLIDSVVSTTPYSQLHTLRSVGLLSSSGTASVLKALASSAATSSHISAYDYRHVGAAVTLAHQRSSQHGIHGYASAHSPIASIRFVQSAYFDNGTMAQRLSRGLSTAPSRLPNQYPLRGCPASIVVGIAESLGGLSHPANWHLSGPLVRLLTTISVHTSSFIHIEDSTNTYVAGSASASSNADGTLLTDESKAIYRQAALSLRHRISFSGGSDNAYPQFTDLDSNPSLYTGSSGPADVVSLFTLLGLDVTLGNPESDL